MDETTCEGFSKTVKVIQIDSFKERKNSFFNKPILFPQHSADRCEESKRQESKGNENRGKVSAMRSLPTDSHTYELGRVVSLMEPGKIEETVHEDRTKKGIPPAHDKPYTYDTRQQNKEIHGGSFSQLITRETATTNEIKCSNNKKGGSTVEVRQNDDISRGKSCSNSTRIESMLAQLGQLRRIGTVGSDEGTKWTSCRFVQPCYRIGRDGSQRSLHNVSEGSTLIETQGCCNNSYMVIDIIASESGRHQLADATNRPCEVSSLTKCMNAKSSYGTYFEEVQNFSFNHIILVGKREDGIIFLDCYGRLLSQI